jgi:hypothetical protein
MAILKLTLVDSVDRSDVLYFGSCCLQCARRVGIKEAFSDLNIDQMPSHMQELDYQIKTYTDTSKDLFIGCVIDKNEFFQAQVN